MTDPERTGGVMTPTSTPRAAAQDWWLEEDDHGVTALRGTGPVAHAEVQEDDASVRLAFWLEERLPRELRSQLTRTVFDHPALRRHRPVSVALPHGESDVLLEVRSRVDDARTRVAGSTCLLEGRVH
jgi:hypothetical protein